jgi:putative ATP-dependent endonuclease of the OLD family
MNIKQLNIRNFRGIKKLDWVIQAPFTCLIGPGDSTKTTILDAIEYVLCPRWNIPLEDCDFYNEDISEPIEIVATVGDIPNDLKSEQKFGLLFRGWNAGGLIDEPGQGDEQVLSVRLEVTDSLEPEWTVYNDRDTEGKGISLNDRTLLGVSRIDAHVDRHLSWGRQSALSKITGDTAEVTAVLIKAHREARKVANFSGVSAFQESAQKTKDAAIELGVSSKSDYAAKLDPRAIVGGQGAISIHDGDIPLRLAGLGSRRLIAMGLQKMNVREGGVLLIDEIENGLEPHRIRHILRLLRESVGSEGGKEGQVFLTSHSATTIIEAPCTNLCVVRSENGTTTVKEVTEELQDVVRAVPESMLGRKVVVCEGKTEYGFCLALEKYWGIKGNPPLVYQGISIVEGVGDSAIERADRLAELGYDTCLFLDSDKPELNEKIEEAKNKGVTVIQWDGAVAIEERIAEDVSWDTLKEVVALGAEIRGDRVFDQICSNLGTSTKDLDGDIDALKSKFPEQKIREAIGKSAKSKNNPWFKRIDFGKDLGKIIVKNLDSIPATDLCKKVTLLGGWIYGSP